MFIQQRTQTNERNELLEIAKQKFGFIKRVDKGWITTVKDLESWRFER